MYCPHFYSIINFEYYNDDLISKKLIKVYKNYIFSTDITQIDNINKMRKLDAVLYEYINDYEFRNEMKTDIIKVNLKNENILDGIVNAIINFFDSYQKLKIRKVQVTRWI